MPAQWTAFYKHQLLSLLRTAAVQRHFRDEPFLAPFVPHMSLIVYNRSGGRRKKKNAGVKGHSPSAQGYPSLGNSYTDKANEWREAIWQGLTGVWGPTGERPDVCWGCQVMCSSFGRFLKDCGMWIGLKGRDL